MEVREATPEEHAEAGRVTALAYREFWPEGSSTLDDYMVRIADVSARAPHSLILVAVEDGRVLGSVTLELADRIPGGHERLPLAPGEAHVRMLGVDPEARRRGVGRALMDACVERALAAGKTELTLDTTEAMTAAHGLYESMGFSRGKDQIFPDGFLLRWYALPLG